MRNDSPHANTAAGRYRAADHPEQVRPVARDHDLGDAFAVQVLGRDQPGDRNRGDRRRRSEGGDHRLTSTPVPSGAGQFRQAEKSARGHRVGRRYRSVLGVDRSGDKAFGVVTGM